MPLRLIKGAKIAQKKLTLAQSLIEQAQQTTPCSLILTRTQIFMRIGIRHTETGCSK